MSNPALFVDDWYLGNWYIHRKREFEEFRQLVSHVLDCHKDLQVLDGRSDVVRNCWPDSWKDQLLIGWKGMVNVIADKFDTKLDSHAIVAVENYQQSFDCNEVRQNTLGAHALA